MQNLTLRGGDGTAEHPAVGRIGWRRHWPNTAGRCAALPFPRPPTNHQTHYKRYSAQKTPIFLFNSGPAVGRGAAGAYWHLISDCQVTTRVRLPAPQFPATLSFWCGSQLFSTPVRGSVPPASSFFARPDMQPARYCHWPLCRLVEDL